MLVRELVFFFQAEDGIRDLVRSRGLGDVYKRQVVAALQRGVGAAMVGMQVGVDQAGQALLGAPHVLSLIHI